MRLLLAIFSLLSPVWSDVSEASCVYVCMCVRVCVCGQSVGSQAKEVVCMYNQITGGTVYLKEIGLVAVVTSFFGQ